jgi:hypothetical protein
VTGTVALTPAAVTSAARWFGSVPTRRVELIRIVTFGYAAAWLVVRSVYVWDVSGLPSRRFEPVGVLAWMGSPPPRVAVMTIWAVALIASVLVVRGRALRATAPVGAAAVLVVVTMTSSYGQVFHTEHLLAVHLAVLAVAVVVERARSDGETSAWPLNLMMVIVATTYVLAGVAKLRFSGLDWVTGDVLRSWVAADNLRKILVGDYHSPLGGWLAGVDWVWPSIAAMTLAVELGGPVALLSGRIRHAWIALAWSFHVGVLVLMAITFPYQLLGIAYLPFLRVELLEAGVIERVRRRRATPA